MFRTQIALSCFLVFAAVGSSAAQTTGRRDTLVLGHGSLSGTWSASDGSRTLVGTWTAVADSAHGAAIGTWTLANAQGATVAFGGWSAAKAAGRWSGGWRANVTGRPGDYSGSWTSSVPLGADAPFVELFETAARAVVSGTWNSGGSSGAWSIRAKK